MTVIDFLIMLSMIHHEGIESMLKSMRKLEPLVKRSLEKTAHPEPVDVPF